MDRDIVPVREMADDLPIGFEIVGFEAGQRLIREHDAEAESVVGLVPLEHGDARLRPRLLHQNGEVQAGRTAADDVNLHARLQAPPGQESSKGYLKPQKFKPKVIPRQEACGLESAVV